MNTLLSFMDKIYGDSKTLSIIYVVGAILLFVFIILLMISLRKKDKNEVKIIDEPKIDENKEIKTSEIKDDTENIKVEEVEKVVPIKDEKKEVETKSNETLESIFEKTTIIPLDEVDKTDMNKDEKVSEGIANETKNDEKIVNQVESNDDEIENLLSRENDVSIKESVAETEKTSNAVNISAEIPDVDSYVDNIVKKAYEKNEQFSSVYVGNNTSTIKLDKVMENLNVDEAVMESIVPDSEKSDTSVKSEKAVEIPRTVSEVESKDISLENKESIETPKTVEIKGNTSSLDGLKRALEEKKKETNLKSDDLKAKLDELNAVKDNNSEAMKAEELLNKLNAMKEK